jgi:poly(hydroxyalkanoate) depolymerase family esterase
MNAKPSIDMTEATRLTREGRLAEAMALLRGERPATDGAAKTPMGRTAPTIDMEPPSVSGGPWRASGSDAAHAAPAGLAGPAGGLDAPPVPEAMRGFLDRMGRLGPAPGLAGRPAPARPSAPLPEGARFEERSHAGEAGSRAYKLYVPSGYAGQPVALVVMLHGCTQSPDDFAAGTRMNELAEERTLLVAYPAQPASAHPSKCWNWYSAGDQRRDRGEPALIAGITRQVMRDFAVDPGRVYVAGLSAGGAAAAIMASAYPDLYAAAGVHSGLACGAASDLPSALAAMRQGGAPAPAGPRRGGRHGRPVPTIVFHGDGDRTVNPVNGDQVIAQAGAPADLETTVIRGRAPGGTAFTRTVQAGADGRPVLEHWLLHGAGHAWSGGSPAGSYTDPRGPDASREMLRFFLEHPMPDRRGG